LGWGGNTYLARQVERLGGQIATVVVGGIERKFTLSDPAREIVIVDSTMAEACSLAGATDRAQIKMNRRLRPPSGFFSRIGHAF